MEATDDFWVMDCSLLRSATARRCSNLRELLEAVRTVSDAVVEHHMMRCVLEDHFELHEFPNDLARWCWTALGDNVLGEQLGVVDPYRHASTAALRATLVNLLEERLWGLEYVPWCRPGLELHLIESRLIGFDTGERIHTPAALFEAIERMSPRSLFFHVHDARRRTAGRSRRFFHVAGKTRGRGVLGRQALEHRLLFPQLEPAPAGPGRHLSGPGRGRPASGKERAMNLLDRYEDIVGHQEVEHLRRLAERLAGKRIVHVNSTRSGGGVAEILGWMVPLMEELGISARWEVIAGSPDFYRVTKAFHNGMQGLPVSLRKSDFELHYEVNRENAARLDLQADIVFVHDPQPVYLPHFTPPGQVGRWIWRCHIDASHPNRSVWKHLEPAVARYDAAVFSMPAFARPIACPKFLILPSIDPLSDKNCAIPEAERLETLSRLGIDPERPLLLQVSRFDRFKDPLGVIEAFRMLQPYHPDMQLALAGGPADDDPEGAEVLREVTRARGRRRQSEGPDARRPTPIARSTPCSVRRSSSCKSRSRRVLG